MSQQNSQKNSQQPSPQWDLGRFVKTLSYFGAVPFLSSLDWFQQWFNSRSNPTVDLERWIPMSSFSDTHPDAGHRLIFDFTQSSEKLSEVWGALDDVVMGGVSQSGIQFGSSAASFSGQVSTANSGGFASVRTRNFEPPLDLGQYTGIELRVKGDGNRYKFMLRTEDRWDGIAYCYSFDTVADQWMTIRIPFSAVVPVFRAKTVSGQAIAPNRITAMQLMLSKFEYDGALNPHFQPGFFQLQIESIQAYR
ncbi:MAG: CIA30 family protein [Oscillatoriophycideae cyanobacterium NC_groundwater_1537_Pr4_S-0.65um_50_18]|nr:CIA30 family protein [Oscillatoriophycideae cyanobacterium NC_groundwater_1537_Pr4_S-0.65um_50_18]